MLRPSALYPVLAATMLLALTSTESWALKRRPTISSPQQCTIDAVGAQADLECEGAICSCCYCDGCYICGADGKDCVWEPAFSEGSCGQQGQIFDLQNYGELPDLEYQQATPLPQLSQPEGGIGLIER